MWIIRNSARDHKGRRETEEKSERKTNHERLLPLGNKLRVAGGEVAGGMG